MYVNPLNTISTVCLPAAGVASDHSMIIDVVRPCECIRLQWKRTMAIACINASTSMKQWRAQGVAPSTVGRDVPIAQIPWLSDDMAARRRNVKGVQVAFRSENVGPGLGRSCEVCHETNQRTMAVICMTASFSSKSHSTGTTTISTRACRQCTHSIISYNASTAPIPPPTGLGRVQSIGTDRHNNR